LSPDRKVLTVAVLNPTESAQEVNVSFKGVDLQGKGKMWQMTGPDVNASNRLGRKPQVEIVETAVKELPSRLKVAPISINLYELDVR
jgi:alpha-N-arabinofuranosidase